MDQRRAAAALFALAACFACATAAPTASNQTALDLIEAPVEGCYYNFQHYGEGDRIMTNEPCLNCTCHNRMLMCYLRVCPFTKAIGQDCTVEKRADQCCPIVTCPDVPVDLLTSTSTSSPAEYGATGLGKIDRYGCSINGKYFAEGSKVPSTPNKPCEHCYCIHNMTTCVMQECTLHVDGCTPIYHKDVCCPIRYSCDHPEDEIPLLDDMTTTVRPTPGFLLTTTTMMPVTQASQDCIHDDKIFADGALIKTEKACEHCYCMKGDIVCVVQECGTPMENEGKNCTSLPPKQGQCCPDTYICEGDELSTARLYEETTTLTPPRRFGIEGSGYRNEPDESFTEISSLGDTEIEGSGEDHLLSTISSFDSDTTEKIYPYSTETNGLSSEITTQSDTDNEYKIFTTPSSLSITSTKMDDNEEKDMDEEKDLNVITTVIPILTTSIDDNLSHKQDNTTNEISITTKTLDQFTTIEPSVTTKLNEISENVLEITTKQTVLDDVDNMTPTDEEFIIATKLPEKTDNIENSFEDPLTTFNPTHMEESVTEQASSETTPIVMTFTEQSTYSSVVTSSHETTTLNVQENEILEENLPARIPGEGDCLLGGVTFKNNTSVPSTNKCHSSCRCTSSIIKCDPIICTPPLEYMENMNDCQPIYDSPESCCPTYVCSTKETIAPESHSQMSGTESPKPIKCVGDECHINQESKTTVNPVEHSILPQNDLNECSNGICDTKTEQIPVSDITPCDKTTGCQVPVIQPCEGESCITKPDVPTNIHDKPDTDNKLCNNENECQVPAITPCIGDDCRTASELPDNKETDAIDKKRKDEENMCNDENCRRKEHDETEAIPCSGTECMQQETLSSSDNNLSSPKPDENIETKPDAAEQPDDFSMLEPQSTQNSIIVPTVPSITTSSEIIPTMEDIVTVRDETATQILSVENHTNLPTDKLSEDDRASTETINSEKETATETIPQVTTQHSSQTSDESFMQYTTLGASSGHITTESATERRTVAVSEEASKDPTFESTTANTIISSQNDKESNEIESVPVTEFPYVDGKTTISEILEESITVSGPHLSTSTPQDESSSDITESGSLFTKQTADSNLSVQPLSDVTEDPNRSSEYPTTEQTENSPTTLAPEAYTKTSVETTYPEMIAISTQKYEKEEHAEVTAEVNEETTEIFNNDRTTIQPDSHDLSNNQPEPEVTIHPSTIDEIKTEKAIEREVTEYFTEVSPAITTELDQKYSTERHYETGEVDHPSNDKPQTQTKTPEIKYTEVTEDFTSAFSQNPIEDKTSFISEVVEQTSETITSPAPLLESQTNTVSAEIQETSEAVVNKETTTLRDFDVNEPTVYTTSKPNEDTYIKEFEKETPEAPVNLSDENENTTPGYNDITKETNIPSLSSSPESISEFVTELTTANYITKNTQTVTETPSNIDTTGNEQSNEPSNELDKISDEETTEASKELEKTDNEQSTESLYELNKTGNEQSTKSSNELDKTTLPETSNKLDKTSDEGSTEPSKELEKTDSEQSTESSNELDKTTLPETSNKLDKTSGEASTEPSKELDNTGNRQSTESSNELEKTDNEQLTESSTELDKTQLPETSNKLDKTSGEESTEPSKELDNTDNEQSTESLNELEKTDNEQSTESLTELDKTQSPETSNKLDKTSGEESTEPSKELDNTDNGQSTESLNELEKTDNEQSTESSTELDKAQLPETSNKSDKTSGEESTEPSKELDNTGNRQSTESSNELEKTDNEQLTESSTELDKTQLPVTSNKLDKTSSEESTEPSKELEKTDNDQSTESSYELDKTEQPTETSSNIDKKDAEQSTESLNALVDPEIAQSTESSNTPKPEILTTGEIEKDETLSKTDKPPTTLFNEPLEVGSTITYHESTDSYDNLGQSLGLEKEELLTTTKPNIVETETTEVNDSKFTNEIPQVSEENNTYVSTTASTYNSDSVLSSTISPIAEQENSDLQQKQTLAPLSLITEKPYMVTEGEDNTQTVAVTESKVSKQTTIEDTTAGIDLLTTKQEHSILVTLTPSTELISEIKPSDLTTELPNEQVPSMSSTSQSVDETVHAAVTEQSGTTVEELTSRPEIEMTSSSKPQIENQPNQGIPNIPEDKTTVMSTTLAEMLTEKQFEEQSTEAQMDVSKTFEVISENHVTNDYPSLIEEQTKQPELLTTEYLTESTKKPDQITEEPLPASTVQEITLSSVEDQSPDRMLTTIVLPDLETATKEPETSVVTNDANTNQEETPMEEIDSTKPKKPEVSTEISYETQTQSATVKDDTPTAIQTDISQDSPIETTEILQTVTEPIVTKSPIENTRLDSIGSTLTDAVSSSTEREPEDKNDEQKVTTEPKYEYSETTPYFVELEEHTHQIIQETSVIPVDDFTTEGAIVVQSTERGDLESISDHSINELQTEKTNITTESPQYITHETTQSSLNEFMTTVPEISSSLKPQQDTEIKEQDKLEPTDEEIKSTASPTEASIIQNEESKTSISLDTEKPSISHIETTATPDKSHTVMNEEAQKPDIPLVTTYIPDEHIKTTIPHYVHDEITSVQTTLFDEKLLETSSTTSKPTTKPDEQPVEDISSPEFPPSGVSGYGQEPDYGEEEQPALPGICRYGGKVYGSTQQIPRDDPCDFCFCFRSDIICLQQSCPPPIHGCREEPIQGFCCPRYECPVSMATTLNVTTTTTTTTTTLPPHFLPHAYKGAAQRRGCHIKGHTYKVGEVVRASSGPCLHCTCGGDGQMKCDPKACTPEPMLRQMIAAAVSSRRRR